MKKILSVTTALLLLTNVITMAEEESDLPTPRYISTIAGGGEGGQFADNPADCPHGQPVNPAPTG